MDNHLGILIGASPVIRVFWVKVIIDSKELILPIDIEDRILPNVGISTTLLGKVYVLDLGQNLSLIDNPELKRTRLASMSAGRRSSHIDKATLDMLATKGLVTTANNDAGSYTLVNLFNFTSPISGETNTQVGHPVFTYVKALPDSWVSPLDLQGIHEDLNRKAMTFVEFIDSLASGTIEIHPESRTRVHRMLDLYEKGLTS